MQIHMQIQYWVQWPIDESSWKQSLIHPWETTTINPLLSPSLSNKPPPLNVFEINKPHGGLKEDL